MHKFVPFVRKAVELELGDDEFTFNETAAELVAKYLDLMEYGREEDGDVGLTEAELKEDNGRLGTYIYQLYTYQSYLLDEGWVQPV